MCLALLKSCDFGFVHQVLTFTRVRQGSLSDASNDLTTSFPCRMQLLATHAPDYLTPEERDTQLARLLSEYYRFLGKSLILGRNAQFWDYHKREMRRAGIDLDRVRLAKGTLAILVDAALKPKEAVKQLLAAKHKRRVVGFSQGIEEKPHNAAAREAQKDEKPLLCAK